MIHSVITSGNDLLSPAILIVTGTTFGVRSIAAFVNGLISVFNQKERGVLVYASTIVGVAFTFFYII